MVTFQTEEGSFRDREGRVFYAEGRVFRALSPVAEAEWQALEKTSFFARLVADGKVIPTRPADWSREQLAELAGFSDRWTTALEHDRLPFISYPYEWTFHMLRDAALLQLELLEAALDEDMMLKDATPYNIQWRGARPVFIDIPSFERWRQGEPWIGYQQFCRLFLFPLMMTAYRGLPFAPWLRGAIDGLTPKECSDLLSWRDLVRPGVLVDVYLQAKLQKGPSGNGPSEAPERTTDDLKRAGFSKPMILNNLGRLRKVVSKLSWGEQRSEWSDYAAQNSYDDENRRIKRDFVEQAMAGRTWQLAWDIGCNTGEYSRLAALHSRSVVAFDADHLAVDRLYLELKASSDGPDNILPLVVNLADPSPALGWRHGERKALSRRNQPDFILCLAVLHHLVISANVPLPEVVEYFAQFDAHLVIEFVTKSDPMVHKLLAHRQDIFHDYELEVFEAALARHFDVLKKTTFHNNTRILFFVGPLAY